MKKIFVIIATCAASMITFLSTASMVHAETRVSGQITTDTVWTKDKSPYVLYGDVNVTNGASLTINPGVIVNVDPKFPNYLLNVDNSKLFIKGIKDDRSKVNIRIALGGSTADISEADLWSSTVNVHSMNSTMNISSSSLYALTGSSLYLWQSKVDVKGSKIVSDGINNIFAMKDSWIDSDYSISNSSFTGKAQNSINNQNTNPIRAMNNWWGKSDGPNTSGIQIISGTVDYTPWLESDPFLSSTTTDTVATSTSCCSSVLFIPGLQASRLFTAKNQLWEPNSNSDVTKLYLNSDGTSIENNIYSGDPIDSALGIMGIYSKFMEYMDSMVTSGYVGEWKSFGYDWRKPVNEVVDGLENKATTTESLIDTVSIMASKSRTGKVTLIAHSNGGLVAKYLVKRLVELDKENIIDTVISVAVPYLGTPEAIRGLLHGGNQSILYGLIAKESTARGLGVNMSSAYSLLPSAEYFKNIFSPTIAFASTSIRGLNDGSYPKEINNSTDQNRFILDTSDQRIYPVFNETNVPIKGNSLLNTASESLHGILDVFDWPANIGRWAISGWNMKTTKGITYGTKIVCSFGIILPSCKDMLTYEANTTNMGDGTVVSPSAEFNSGSVVSVDLKKESEVSGGVKHANILESSSVQKAIGDIITTGKVTGDIGTSVKLGRPDYSENTTLVLSTHSPVELHVYDSKGNHTGRIALPAGASGSDSYYVGAFEEKIPGTTYEEIGEGTDHETYVSIPESLSGQLRVEILGNDFGYATFDIEKMNGDIVTYKEEFAYIPVNPLTEAKIELDTDRIFSYDPIVQFIPALRLDKDGDGAVDSSIDVNQGQIPTEVGSIEDTRKLVETLLRGESKSRQILDRLDKIIELAKKGKLKQADSQGKKLSLNIGHLKLNTLSTEDRSRLVDLIDAIISEIERVQ